MENLLDVYFSYYIVDFVVVLDVVDDLSTLEECIETITCFIIHNNIMDGKDNKYLKILKMKEKIKTPPKTLLIIDDLVFQIHL